MQTINILSNEIINKIAAGEVIESPTSVIKELVENSIDAGSKNIKIEIKKAGFQKIIIEDDGIGMAKEDAKLCFQRHATSKIKKFEEISDISSMGFRGEALASIASISIIDLKTSQNELGINLKVEKGNILNIKETARTRGTTFTISSLFHNVPVRKNFQKSFSYITRDITNILMKLAMANYDISFTFISDEKEVFKTFADSFQSICQSVLGKEFVASCTYLDKTYESIRLYGYIGYPISSKKNRYSQHVFINKRSVFSPVISKFIKEAYATRISEDEYPIFSLHLEVPNNLLDVNVHPQKKEIRLTEELFIKDCIRKAINSAFEMDLKKEAHFVNDDVFFEKVISNENYSVQKENIFKKFENKSFQNVFEDNFFQDFYIKDHFLFIDTKYLSHILEIENQNLVVIDLKNAYASYLYDCLQNKKIEVQSLLVPINIELAKDDALHINEIIEKITSLGFDAAMISKSTISIHAVPSVLKKEEIKDFFQEIIKDLFSLGKTNVPDNIFNKKLAQNISRFAKSKTEFSNVEANRLINMLIKLKNPYFDPLGKPNMICLEKKDFEKLFNTKKNILCPIQKD